MKIIHCADIHLGSSMSKNLEPCQIKERNAELLNTFEKMVDFAKTYQVQAILITGDLFDTTDVPLYIENAFFDILRRYETIAFFYIRGNHDRMINWMTRQIPDNLHLFLKDWKRYINGDVVITGIECERDNLSKKAEYLRLPKDKINIVMAHGKIMDKSDPDLAEDQIPLGILRDRGIDYLALGHIHSYQMERLDGRGIWCYSGCLEGRGFDECGQKGFVLLDIDEELRRINTQFVPFGKRRICEIEVVVSGCMTSAQMVRKIQEKLCEESVRKEDLLRVILTGELDVECEKTLSYIKEKFLDNYYVFQLLDKTSIYVDYSDYIVDETLKGEYVRVIQETDLSEEDKAAIIRMGIKALSGEELQE